MQITTKITFVGFLLAVSTLTVSAAKAKAKMPVNSDASSNIEYRLSRITKAIQQRGIETSNTLNTKTETSIARGFANRSGRGGFVNRGGGGFVNRSGGGGFLNRSPWINRGGFYNRY